MLVLIICFCYNRKESVSDDQATHYRDSFIEIMNEIEDWLFSLQ